MYIIDRDYQLLAVNRSRAERAGAKPSQLVGQRCYRALTGDDDPCPGCRVRDVFRSGQAASRASREWLDSERVVEWEVSAFPILDGTERPTQAILLEQDSTEKRRLAADLVHSEKLAAVGQLAAGVAHEINNPLAAIIANAQMLLRDLPAGEADALESVRLIEQAGVRASQVVRNLLNFARKEQFEFALTDVNATIQDAMAFLQHEFIARPIQLVYELAEGLPWVRGSRDHLQGVWINIVMNAIDALDHRPGQIRIATQAGGGELKVTIADTGKGIAPDRVSRIFEPFFTTKSAGHGTGLGLSVCHRIIKQHGGRIQVESQPGSGTRFTIVLPLS
jgi:two-component system NtrC family sensor kinase